MKTKIQLTALLLTVWLAAGTCVWAEEGDSGPEDLLRQLLFLVTGNESQQSEALGFLQTHWQADITPMVIEAASLIRPTSFAQELMQWLEQKTGQHFGTDIDA